MHQVRRVLYGKPAVALEIGEDARDAARANDFELQVSFYHNGDDKFQMIRIQNSQNWQFFTFTMINSSIISIIAVTNKIISNKRQKLWIQGWSMDAAHEETRPPRKVMIILSYYIISWKSYNHIIKIILFCHDWWLSYYHIIMSQLSYYHIIMSYHHVIIIIIIWSCRDHTKIQNTLNYKETTIVRERL